MDEDIKKYADSLYEHARMESDRALQAERAQAVQRRAGLDRGDLPLSGPDIQIMLGIFGNHIERCMVGRFDSYEQAYSQASRTPSEQEFTEILNDWKRVRVLEIEHSTNAMRDFIGRRAMVGVSGPINQTTLENSSGSGHDRVLQKWKIWKAKAQLKPAAARIAEPKKRRDALLSAYDRAEFDQDLAKLILKGSGALPLGLVFMDLDKFKSINDAPADTRRATAR